MFRKIWQKILKFIRNLFGKNQTPPPAQPKPQTPPPPLSDSEYETKFLEILDGVNRGMGRGYIKAFLTTVYQPHLIAWLHRFAERLLQTPENHAELGERLIKFGNLCDGELGEIALKIGQNIIAQLPPPPVEEWPVIEAEFRGNGLELVGKDAEAEAWVDRGNEQAMRGEFEEAIESYNQAIAIKRDFHEAFFYLGNSQYNLGRYEEAIDSYSQAVALKQDYHEVFFYRGNSQYNLGRYEEAIDSYSQAVALKQDYHEAFFYLGVSQANLGQHEEAIDSYNQAIAFKQDYHEAFFNLGILQAKLGRYKEAIDCYNQAIAIKSDDYKAFFNRGLSQVCLERTDEEAIESYNQAIAFKHDYYEAFYFRGLSQGKLGRYQEAIDSFNQTISIKPDDYKAFNNLGLSQAYLGRHKEAIDSYNQAIAFKADYYDVFSNLGVSQHKLGRYEEAIASFNKAIAFKSDDDNTFYNRGVSQYKLDRYEEAIASYNQAIAIKSDDEKAFNMRGISQAKLDRHEEAINSFNEAIAIKPDDHEVWLNRGRAAGLLSREKILTSTTNILFNSTFYLLYPHLNKAGYDGEIATYQQGIKNCPQDTHPLGWGMLHYHIGIAQYNRGRELKQQTYIQQARNSYETALQTLTETGFPEEHLEVLQRLIRLFLYIKENQQAEKYQLQGMRVLQTLLNQPISSYKKQQLHEKLWSIRQLSVDILAQKNLPIEAIQSAETDKNIYLTWILDAYKENILSPTWQQMQQMLSETTAIIYWHLSQNSLTTFILKANQPQPILLETTPDIDTLQTWITAWKTQYQNYCNQPKTEQPKTEQPNKNHPWREQMPEKISQLANLLHIPTLINHLQNIPNLILIPHRDLHNLPLETLFPTNYNLTRLPSIQTGKNLRIPKPNPQQILSIENPENQLEKLQFAPIESALICRKFPTSKRLTGHHPTTNNIIPELQKKHDIFHFTGHADHNPYQAKNSSLYLAGNDKLTLEQISQIPLQTTHLVTLSACETGITKEEIKIDYVGLVSAFLKHRIPYVLSTLWRVPEEASMLLMVKFYELRKTHPEAIALAQAKTWLQNQSWQDIHQFYQSLETELKTEPHYTQRAVEKAIIRTSQQPPNIQPYQHPYYWAAFIINGYHPTA